MKKSTAFLLATLLYSGIESSSAQEVEPTIDIRDYLTTRDGNIDKSSISLRDAKWAFITSFNEISMRDFSRSVSMLMGLINISEEEATSFLTSVPDAILDREMGTRSYVNRACTNFSYLSSNKDILLDEIRTIQQSERDLQSNLISRLESGFDVGTKASLNEYVENHLRDKIKSIDADYAMYLSHDLVSAESVASALCNR